MIPNIKNLKLMLHCNTLDYNAYYKKLLKTPTYNSIIVSEMFNNLFRLPKKYMFRHIFALFYNL